VSGTRIFGINNLGNLSIEVFFSDGSEKVATRINGHYSTPSQPANTNMIASANGLNNSNVVVGYYFDSTTNTDRASFLKMALTRSSTSARRVPTSPRSLA
jgi:hypothetical protein